MTHFITDPAEIARRAAETSARVAMRAREVAVESLNDCGENALAGELAEPGDDTDAVLARARAALRARLVVVGIGREDASGCRCALMALGELWAAL